MIRRTLPIVLAAAIAAVSLLATPDLSLAAVRGDAGPPADRVEADADVTPPVPLERVNPEYPDGARDAGLEGTVVVRLVVDREGLVEEAEVLRSSDVDELDDAALKAAWQWTFEPGEKDGAPVEAEVAIPFRFELP
jgi:protein TonB